MAVAEEEGAKGLGQGSPPFQKQLLSVMSSILRCSGCILVFSVSSLVSISCVPSHPWSTFMQVSAWFLMPKTGLRILRFSLAPEAISPDN